jgi:hypothetical protein
MKQYNVGSVNELPIVFVYLTDDYIELEKFLIDLEFIKETIKYCTIRKAILIKQNKKLLNKKDDRKYLIIVDSQNLEYADELLTKTKKTSINPDKKNNGKKSSKKTSKKPSKKHIIKKSNKN